MHLRWGSQWRPSTIATVDRITSCKCPSPWLCYWCSLPRFSCSRQTHLSLCFASPFLSLFLFPFSVVVWMRLRRSILRSIRDGSSRGTRRSVQPSSLPPLARKNTCLSHPRSKRLCCFFSMTTAASLDCLWQSFKRAVASQTQISEEHCWRWRVGRRACSRKSPCRAQWATMMSLPSIQSSAQNSCALSCSRLQRKKRPRNAR